MIHINNRSIPVFKMTVSMAIFGSIGFFTTKTNLPSFDLVFVRCISATLFLAIYWFFSGKYKDEPWNKKEILRIMLCGVFLVFNWVFLFKAFEQMSVTIAISIYHLAPIIVFLVGSILFREKLTLFAFFSILICFIGTALIAGINGNTSFESFFSSGMLWGLLAALFYACTTLLGKGIKQMSGYAITFIQTGLGIFLLLPFVQMDHFSTLTATNWFFTLATGFIHTGFVYYLFFDSLRNLSAKTISILVFLDPAVAILLDTVFTGFRPTIIQVAGIVLIFIAIGLTFPKKKQPSTQLNTRSIDK